MFLIKIQTTTTIMKMTEHEKRNFKGKKWTHTIHKLLYSSSDVVYDFAYETSKKELLKDEQQQQNHNIF